MVMQISAGQYQGPEMGASHASSKSIMPSMTDPASATYRAKSLGEAFFMHLKYREALKLKLIPNSLYGAYVVVAQFFAQFSDVDINGSVAYHYVFAPNQL